ncbi:hypothetical protein [Actinomadura madurae]|uniref:hypothetical protein n=1 Tax=Actinomadura madurae TaxID=1993 RepID=UPI0020D2328F|nr:hypothetical protein [Actinomadura madurae]MCP9981699.1 hypothetical protein [Actinomadura madurae]
MAPELRAALSPESGIQPVTPFGRLGSRTRRQPGRDSRTGTQVGPFSWVLGSSATAGAPGLADTGTVASGCTTVPSVVPDGAESRGRSFSVV